MSYGSDLVASHAEELLNDYPETYPNTRQSFYGDLLTREAESSTRLDGDTVDVGPVVVHDVREQTENEELTLADCPDFGKGSTTVTEEVLRAENADLLNIKRNLEQDIEFLVNEVNGDTAYMTALEDRLMELEYAEFERQMRNLANEKPARIRVYLSRQLTWSEAETLSSDHHVLKGRGVDLVSVRVGKSRRTVYVDAYMPSRELFTVLASALDAHFVNVHPSAVKTFNEFNGVY